MAKPIVPRLAMHIFWLAFILAVSQVDALQHGSITELAKKHHSSREPPRPAGDASENHTRSERPTHKYNFTLNGLYSSTESTGYLTTSPITSDDQRRGCATSSTISEAIYTVTDPRYEDSGIESPTPPTNTLNDAKATRANGSYSTFVTSVLVVPQLPISGHPLETTSDRVSEQLQSTGPSVPGAVTSEVHPSETTTTTEDARKPPASSTSCSVKVTAETSTDVTPTCTATALDGIPVYSSRQQTTDVSAISNCSSTQDQAIPLDQRTTAVSSDLSPTDASVFSQYLYSTHHEESSSTTATSVKPSGIIPTTFLQPGHGADTIPPGPAPSDISPLSSLLPQPIASPVQPHPSDGKPGPGEYELWQRAPPDVPRTRSSYPVASPTPSSVTPVTVVVVVPAPTPTPSVQTSKAPPSPTVPQPPAEPTPSRILHIYLDDFWDDRFEFINNEWEMLPWDVSPEPMDICGMDSVGSWVKRSRAGKWELKDKWPVDSWPPSFDAALLVWKYKWCKYTTRKGDDDYGTFQCEGLDPFPCERDEAYQKEYMLRCDRPRMLKNKEYMYRPRVRCVFPLGK